MIKVFLGHQKLTKIRFLILPGFGGWVEPGNKQVTVNVFKLHKHFYYFIHVII